MKPDRAHKFIDNFYVAVGCLGLIALFLFGALLVYALSWGSRGGLPN